MYRLRQYVHVEALGATHLRALNADGTEQEYVLAAGDTFQLASTPTDYRLRCQYCGHSRLAHVEWITEEIDGEAEDVETFIPCRERDCDCPAWMDFTPLRKSP